MRCTFPSVASKSLYFITTYSYVMQVAIKFCFGNFNL